MLKTDFSIIQIGKTQLGTEPCSPENCIHRGILPLLLYGAPVWINAINKASYKLKITRVQRLINIRLVSNGLERSPIILTGLTPIDIKIEEAAQLYQLTRGNRKEEAIFNQDMGVKHWLHPAVKVTIFQDNNEDNGTTQIFTDGSKSEQGVGAGIAVYRSGTHTKSLKYRLNKKCTNNQAEQLSILKSLEYIESIHTRDKSVTIYTNGHTTLNSLQNNNIHTYLIEKIRRKATELEQTEWKIHLCWVKAHVGILGNELADTLEKDASTNLDIAECYNKVPKSIVKSELEDRSVDNRFT
jgi:ribonuclease HI